MNDQRRVLLAFVLMAAVLAATQWWYSRLEVAEELSPTPETAAEREQPLAEPAPIPETEVADEAVASAPPEGEPAGEAAVEETAAEETPAVPAGEPIVVETPLYRVALDPVGGRLRQIELSLYPSFTDPGEVNLVPEGEVFLERYVDLGEGPEALGVITFTTNTDSLSLAPGDAPATVVLRAPDRPIVQTYRFDPSTYVIDYQLDVGAGSGVLTTRLAPGLRSNEKNESDDRNQMRGVVRVDGEIVSRKADQVDEGEALALGGVIDWAGFKSKYFLGLVLAPDAQRVLTTTRMDPAMADSVPGMEIAIGAPIREGRSEYRLYFGPQEYRRLAALNDGLDDVNQYGWSWIRWMITPFAKLCVVVMLWLHKFVPSYGIVLVLFAVLVRLLMWPLTTKSYASIRAMQKLQPELQRVRDTYKSDPQRMQQETMRLYREKKVNPLGGCLPNLIPMPILFALFFVFQGTIEFRGQPFLWLPDLSQPDPIYILPVFMGATIYATSKITATDPKMNAMTYAMPVVLTFVFLNLASGLVLYYALSNLLTFAQQWMLKDRFDNSGGEAPEPASA